MTTWKIIISLCNKWFRFCFGFAFVILVCEDLLFLALQGVSQLCSNNSNNIIRVCILLYFEEMKNFTRPRHTICLLIWEVNLCLNLKKMYAWLLLCIKTANSVLFLFRITFFYFYVSLLFYSFNLSSSLHFINIANDLTPLSPSYIIIFKKKKNLFFVSVPWVYWSITLNV